MLNNVVVVVVSIITLSALFKKSVRQSIIWRATVTPLASIIGSGFLVSAPVLILSTGIYAPIAMGAIVITAYALGSSLRFNILNAERAIDRAELLGVYRLEVISGAILGVAYLISITFYLKLLSTFLLTGIQFSTNFTDKLLTTVILLFIGVIGKTRGLHSLESLELYSVNIKISIIIALIVSHLVFNFAQIANGEWVLKVYPHEPFVSSLRKLLGVLIIIQGFETSRYLKGTYNASIRVRTMKYAQLLSGAIYVVFILSTLTAFNSIHSLSETTTIEVCRMIAPILPFLLIIAAVMSQFSAAIADTIGSGGLIVESLSNKISLENSYLIIIFVGMVLTWTTNIYSIITLASRAFAIYYGLQMCITLLILNAKPRDKHNYLKIALYSLLLILMLSVVVFGLPVKHSGEAI